MMSLKNEKPITVVLLFFASVVTTGCAMDRDTVQRLEDEQFQQSLLLAEQNLLLEAHSELLSQQIAGQQQMIEALAGVSRELEDYQERTVAPAIDDGESNGLPVLERTLVLSEEGKAVLGRNEWAWLELLNRNLKARIDTGALSSSLSAVDLQPFERDGRDWIRFRVPDEEHPEGGEVYETPLVRHVRIRQASADDLERRPVVRLKVRLGRLSDDTEFTLTNRENMLYPLLLGRNFLRDVAVVDVARKFVQKKYSPERVDVAE